MKMQKFLLDLNRKIKAIKLNKNTPAPDGELEDGDKVVGILPDDMKRFYAVLIGSHDELRKECKLVHGQIADLLTALHFPKAKPEKAIAFAEQHTLLHERHKITRKLFWHGVREAFPNVTTANSIGLRKGWQVVTSRPSPVDLLELLSVMGPFRL